MKAITSRSNVANARHVLIVDDNALMRMILASMLIQRGFDVTETATAEDGLAIIQQKPIDLLMLDIMLTGMSGIELCHILREDPAMVNLPVVAFTAGHQVERIAHLRLAGFNEFLFKPVDTLSLDTVLGRLRVVH